MESINKKALLLINFGLTEILSYGGKLSDLVSRDLNLFYEQKKGLALLKEKFVYNIRFYQDNQVLYIEARVKAEMKTKVSYQVSVDIMSDNSVKDCKCACPAGASPCLN